MDIHDTVDLLEKRISDEFHIPITIHMDPIDTDNETTKEWKEAVKRIVKSISDQLSIHDFRMVSGKTHTNLIFDVNVPFEIGISNDDIEKKINDELVLLYPTVFFLVIHFDRSYL